MPASDDLVACDALAPGSARKRRLAAAAGRKPDLEPVSTRRVRRAPADPGGPAPLPPALGLELHGSNARPAALHRRRRASWRDRAFSAALRVARGGHRHPGRPAASISTASMKPTFSGFPLHEPSARLRVASRTVVESPCGSSTVESGGPLSWWKRAGRPHVALGLIRLAAVPDSPCVPTTWLIEHGGAHFVEETGRETQCLHIGGAGPCPDAGRERLGMKPARCRRRGVSSCQTSGWHPRAKPG